MNKEAPIGADFDMTISLIITEGIGTNWCLFIHSNCAPERYCHIKIGTNWCGSSYDSICHESCDIKIGTNWCRS